MKKSYDEIIIGTGIVGITYAFLLKHIKPDVSILFLEKFREPATESSNAWNNAGTWHGANCEVNYTPEQNGVINIDKALRIHEQATKTLELLTFMKERGILSNPKTIINRTSHVSLVFGQEDRAFLHKRRESMVNHHFFSHMSITESFEEISKIVSPLLITGRAEQDNITATVIDNGAGINYGFYTKTMYKYLSEKTDIDFLFNTTAQKISRDTDGYLIKTNTGKIFESTKLILAAGGGTLPIMQKMNMPSADLYAGFPVGGKFLVCKNPEVTEKIQAKVYGKASVGAPPMSVPHFDTRHIDGTRYILFGPQATFNPRFLKQGSIFDLITSIRPKNIFPMLSVAVKEFSLVKYLVTETLSGKGKLFKQLQGFYPEAQYDDWVLVTAGQRVQIIKRLDALSGDLKLGTEIVIDNDNSVGALLGASPGATVAPAIMLEMLEKLHPEEINDEWITSVRDIIPSYKHNLVTNPEIYKTIRSRVDDALGLNV